MERDREEGRLLELIVRSRRSRTAQSRFLGWDLIWWRVLSAFLCWDYSRPANRRSMRMSASRDCSDVVKRRLNTNTRLPRLTGPGEDTQPARVWPEFPTTTSHPTQSPPKIPLLCRHEPDNAMGKKRGNKQQRYVLDTIDFDRLRQSLTDRVNYQLARQRAHQNQVASPYPQKPEEESEMGNSQPALVEGIAK